ncbi:MAG: competence/damage-inducible protein A [Bacteroidetes bacterium]|jgi:nicotinamide-nucleotide amidase|nr:competence/damage-inducible protein A [Bacteroidota bacterium]
MRRAAIINIGDEILLGQIVNTNASWMSESLSEIGVQVVSQQVVSDGAEDIRQALDYAQQRASLILLTGGLGPTKDDITKKVLVDYCGDELTFDAKLYERLQLYFKKMGREATEAHRIQCFMPDRAEQLVNKMGTAPGMLFERGENWIVSLPGVPYEMKYLMNEEVLPRLQKERKGLHLKRMTILTVGRGESQIAEYVEDLEDALPSHIKLAYLPHLARVRLRLTATGSLPEKLDQELSEWKSAFSKRLGNLVYGYGTTTLSQAVQNGMVEKNLTLATAESCTGGNVAREITSNPGASAYFVGGLIPYSNSMKEKFLDVPREVIEKHGAVSEETVRAMVSGAIRNFGVDIAVATSGIAGPGGGTPEKPVGTVWLACGNSEQIITKCLQLSKNRSLNIEYSTIWALNLIRRFLMAA